MKKSKPKNKPTKPNQTHHAKTHQTKKKTPSAVGSNVSAERLRIFGRGDQGLEPRAEAAFRSAAVSDSGGCFSYSVSVFFFGFFFVLFLFSFFFGVYILYIYIYLFIYLWFLLICLFMFFLFYRFVCLSIVLGLRVLWSRPWTFLFLLGRRHFKQILLLLLFVNRIRIQYTGSLRVYFPSSWPVWPCDIFFIMSPPIIMIHGHVDLYLNLPGWPLVRIISPWSGIGKANPLAFQLFQSIYQHFARTLQLVKHLLAVTNHANRLEEARVETCALKSENKL